MSWSVVDASPIVGEARSCNRPDENTTYNVQTAAADFCDERSGCGRRHEGQLRECYTDGNSRTAVMEKLPSDCGIITGIIQFRLFRLPDLHITVLNCRLRNIVQSFIFSDGLSSTSVR